MINGKKAVIITKEGVSQLCLIDEKKENYLLITGSMEQTDDLVKLPRIFNLNKQKVCCRF